MFNLIATISLNSANLFFVVCLIVSAMFILSGIYSMIKEAVLERNPSWWNYKFYKKHTFLINYQAEQLLEKLGGADFSQDQIIKIINDFNALDPKARCQLTPNMVEFQKQLLKDSEPARAISEKKTNFVNNI